MKVINNNRLYLNFSKKEGEIGFDIKIPRLQKTLICTEDLLRFNTKPNAFTNLEHVTVSK